MLTFPTSYPLAPYLYTMKRISIDSTRNHPPARDLPLHTAEQGFQLIQLIQLDVTILVHYDDCDVFASPLEDFRRIIEVVGLLEKVVFLDRRDQYCFRVME